MLRSRNVLACAAILLAVAPAVSAAAPRKRDVGKFARATTLAVAGMRAIRSDVARRNARFKSAVAACENELHQGPPERRAIARAVRAYAHYHAVETPLTTVYARFARRLNAAHARDRRLRAGARAWRSVVVVLRRIPTVPGGFCAAMARWSATGYAPGSAPTSIALYNRLVAQNRSARRRIAAVAVRLRRLGARGGIVHRFTVSGLSQVAWGG